MMMVYRGEGSAWFRRAGVNRILEGGARNRDFPSERLIVDMSLKQMHPCTFLISMSAHRAGGADVRSQKGTLDPLAHRGLEQNSVSWSNCEAV